MHRRGPDDKEWKEVREKVRQRDKVDRMLRIVTPVELILLKKKAGPLIHTLDPAHFLPVSARPDLCYKTYNIVLLNRWSHTNLDYYKHPITGEPITKEEVRKWWIRILKGNKSQYEYLKSLNLIREDE